MKLLHGVLELLTGATGVRLKHTSGNLQVRNISDTAFTGVQASEVKMGNFQIKYNSTLERLEFIHTIE